MTSNSDALIENQIYGTFAALIDTATVQRVFGAFSIMMTNKVTHCHLLFQSTGGYVGDGIALYNFFRVLPFELSLYNVGQVASIASVAFLGAQRRKTSAYAAFMLHRSSMSPQSATAAKLKNAAESLVIDDERTEAILRAHLTLSDEQWTRLGYHDLTFSGPEAVKVGLANEVSEFAPPSGTQLFNLV